MCFVIRVDFYSVIILSTNKNLLKLIIRTQKEPVQILYDNSNIFIKNIIIWCIYVLTEIIYQCHNLALIQLSENWLYLVKSNEAAIMIFLSIKILVEIISNSIKTKKEITNLRTNAINQIVGNHAKAKLLRIKNNLELIPGNKPGYYKWWAKKDSVELLLPKLEYQFDSIEKYLEKKIFEDETYYCIYIGEAHNESIRDRINLHINGSNPNSTLRRSLASIISQDITDKIAANKFIDELIVEYFYIDEKVNTPEAKVKLNKIETELLNTQFLYILNINKNKHKLSHRTILRNIRKTSKIK